MVLFIAALMFVGTTAEAADHKNSDHHGNRVAKRYHRAQPIVFIEAGVKFFIYPEGEIDFKILRTRSRQNVWNNTNGFNTPGGYYGYRNNTPHHRTVRYDYYGRLKRVGSNYIAYNRYNQVRRVGTVILRYNRRGLVNQVGGLRIFYNKYNKIRYVEGDVHFSGCGYCGINGCTMPHDPYYDQRIQPRHFDKRDHNHYYKNRKRFKTYRDDDDDYDDD